MIIGLVLVGISSVVLLLLLLPVFQAERTGDYRMSCPINLRQIGMALHNYHDTYGTLPPAYIADEDGKPMHSWRVLILPYIGGQAVYDAYDFSQPWNSPANEQLLDRYLPDGMQCPDHIESSAECCFGTYFIVNVPDRAFDGAESTSLSEISAADGTSNTLLVVEVAGSTAKWYEPVDLTREALDV